MSSSTTRLTDEFRYLLDMIILVVSAGGRFRAAADGAGRCILSVAGPPIRGGERAVLFGPLVPDRMHPDDLAIAGKLNRASDDADLDAATPPRVPDPVVGAGNVSGGVHNSGDGQPVGGVPRSAAALPQLDLLLLAGVGFATLHVFGDQHLTVEDPHQMIGGACQMACVSA
jgi:hypothetical protein